MYLQALACVKVDEHLTIQIFGLLMFVAWCFVWRLSLGPLSRLVEVVAKQGGLDEKEDIIGFVYPIGVE